MDRRETDGLTIRYVPVKVGSNARDRNPARTTGYNPSRGYVKPS